MGNTITLGQFRNEIGTVTDLHFTVDNPLEPLSISMPVDRVGVVLGASPYITLHSGSAAAVLSHITRIRRSVKDGKRSYKIACNDYSSNFDNPAQVEFRLIIGAERHEMV